MMLCAVVFGYVSAGASPSSSSLLTWSKLAPGTSPPARQDAAIAFDGATNTTVLFGGQSGSQLLDDTWIYDGSTWTLQHPATSPPALASASMAYDNIGHRLVLFGGLTDSGSASNATWTWDGTTWTSQALDAAAVPPARYAASMASDSVTGTAVLFGGLSASGVPLGDTWSWSGNAWVQAAPTASPSARSAAAMTFDAIRGDVVLFGGAPASPPDLADTWTWDGTTWSQQHPAGSPPARSDASFGFDLGSGNAVLFGGLGGNSGSTTLGDTWLWDGTTWATSLPLTAVPSLSPPSRSGAALATSAGSGRLILFGGRSGAVNSVPLADTWEVSTVGTIPPSTTTTLGGGTTTTSGANPPTTTAPKSTPPTTPAAVPTSLPPAPVTAALAVAQRSVRPGDDVRVSGSGFAPHSRVTITLHSSATVVGTAWADADGNFAATVVVPTNVSTGPHHLVATGHAKSGGQALLEAQLSVMAPSGGIPWLLLSIMLALTLLLAAGAGVVLVASTRWHAHSAGGTSPA